ncbi:3'(2'),5'-bisphosphate nucleotidase CysQ [Halomonas halocynthiae]|uniref:3'(2'),5'-bisphosphate nucleotidase CysQ n=1 Tax=Halomonas halocynthiae TaxID=176290 RepID=UPI0003F6DA14|nr:3'(2'),5'-bisphosphate nucleotidase CysQ [Halomonas halocynthiae]
MSGLITHDIRQALLDGVLATGREVLEVYRHGFSVQTKPDNSPLTEADLLAHRALTALLQAVTPNVPVLSEESPAIDYAIRRDWSRYWLVDPVDGTREFIDGTGEFSLNVALIENGEPIFGIVHAPVLGVSWIGQQGQGAVRIEGEKQRSIQVRPLPSRGAAPWRVVGSRSHRAGLFDQFCDSLPPHERLVMGSSIKLCLVAEGEVDLYPRFGPTCEWDTAAAQAVVSAAGGGVLNARTLEPLRCNQQDSLFNPSFIVCGQRDERWELALNAALVHDAYRP